MSKAAKIKALINSIHRAHAANQFPNYIEYIRFPHFKNLLDNTRIDFSFPLTVLTGLNGSGKSSALHAIYGAPKNRSTGRFWFSTLVDPIQQESNAPNCFVYGYKSAAGGIFEVLKSRIGTSKGADYWEPSRPIAAYGMTLLPGGKRRPAIEKKVVYLDFRAELSAFDQFFYFGQFSITSTLRSKQDVLRKYSKYVKSAIDTGTVVSVRNRKNSVPVTLTAAEIATVAKILGKTYDACVLLVHNFYGSGGLTAYFKTNALSYSEAYAGRGEYAVVKLVHEVSKVPNNSLIILDEPEVSLHPGAQEELKIFLLETLLAKKLQIVISTHSPKFVEFLPDNAIKIFLQDPSGKFIVQNSSHYLEAFQSIGMELHEDDKYIVIVEDITAKTIVEKVLTSMGTDYALLFRVIYYPGGSEEIYKRAVTYSEENEKHKFILLDGDKRKAVPDPSSFGVADAKDFSFLERTLKDATNIGFEKLGFRINGTGKTGDVAQKIASSNTYLAYLSTNLGYLPGRISEEMLWDEAYVTRKITEEGGTVPAFTTDYKRNIMMFANGLFGDDLPDSTASAKKLLINEMIKSRNSSYVELAGTLKSFKDSIPD
ncbi:ATP-dependent nuclease [Hymenobacter nivis]|uniref:ATPase AAA-type core domain-containing protein n=1 Tax=Hymenobacter nivis TaxID=1850093 RepID=A0A2Z3GTU4_9BACT|nr:AAA family ATPase [Hymenobacter nivis]AWM32110.1 hypothetical protein DDQ68_04450 [Hymenobacter nivis]